MKIFVAAPSAPWALRSHALCTLDHPATGKTRAGAGVRFARPNIQIHDAHVVDLVPMGLCAVSRWCEGCRNKGKAQLSSALDRISERITLAFQTQSHPGSTSKN
jgi:hypothetical protein